MLEVTGIAGSTRLQPLDQLLALPAERHELQRFREPEHHRHGNEERDRAAEVEHRPPSEDRNQRRGDEPAERGAGGEADGDRHDQRHPPGLRAVLAHEGRRLRDDRAEADAGDETIYQQLLDGGGPGCQDRDDRKEESRADEHRPAPDAVGHHAEDQGADEDAEVAGGEHRAERRGGDTPFLHDGRRRVAERLHIEAVHDQGQQAEREHAPLHGPERAVVDELGQVDAPGGRPWYLHQRCAPGDSRCQRKARSTIYQLLQPLWIAEYTRGHHRLVSSALVGGLPG